VPLYLAEEEKGMPTVSKTTGDMLIVGATAK